MTAAAQLVEVLTDWWAWAWPTTPTADTDRWLAALPRHTTAGDLDEALRRYHARYTGADRCALPPRPAHICAELRTLAAEAARRRSTAAKEHHLAIARATLARHQEAS